MVEISIICLIYKSKKLAKAVYDSAYKYTPKLKNGQAEFLFVANDPTVELVSYLKTQNYPFIININDHLADNDLLKLGFGKPEYMRRVYQGYNQGIMQSKGQKIVLINSDNFFSTDWLENLLKYSDYKKVVTSTLVEPGHEEFGIFPGAIQQDFGKTVETYNDEDFENYVARISKTGYTSGGAYMPCLLYKDIAILAGLYPEGNIAGKTFNEVVRYGDEFFYDNLKRFGVEHITAKDSIVYHLKEGEKSEAIETAMLVDDIEYKRGGLNRKHKIKPANLISYIKPEVDHQKIIDLLGEKITVIIMHFNSKEELCLQIEQITKQINKNIDIIVLYDDKSFIEDKIEDIVYIYTDKEKKGVVLYNLLYSMYGEYLFVPYAECVCGDDLFGQINDKDVVYGVSNKKADQNKTIDSINSFIIPKRVLLNDVNMFLKLLMYSDKRILGKYPLVVIEIPEHPVEPEVDPLVLATENIESLSCVNIRQQQLIDEINTARQGLINERDALYSSSSWKITKPARLVGKGLKSFKHNGVKFTARATAKKVYSRLRKGNS